MLHTPMEIVALVSFLEGVESIQYMWKCKDNMSSLIGNVWQKIGNDWIEVSPEKWPPDSATSEYSNRIRWGDLGSDSTQINVRYNGVINICKYDGEKVTVLMAR